MDNNIRVDITPDKSLIQKLGLVGYRTEQAVAELLDNSIDARISDEKETIEVHLDFQKKWIGIRDNGHGMDKQDLTNAMTIAKGTKADGELGQFGIGMKSACSALGKKFTITTSKINSNKEYRTEYDEKSWLSDEAQNWKNFIITEKTLTEEENWHGTRITISELNVPLYPNQVSKFKDSFGIRYFPYLNTEQVSIQINTVFCKPEKPDVVEGSKKNIQIELEFGKKINGYVALLKKRSIKGHYGLHLFKNGRLIKAYEKFGFPAHPENAKIIGELNLDHVPVNFNKSAFIEESPEYEKAVNAFRLSTEFKETIQSSKSKSESTVSVESVFDYFNKKSSAQYLERSVRSKVSQELLDNTEPFVIKTGDNLIEIGIKSLKNKPLYIIEKHNSKIRVTINKDDEAFRFVKNPLFLIGIIASEIKLLGENPNFEQLLEKRNHDVKEFLNTWSEKRNKKEIFRDREVKIPRMPNYKLADELIEVHDYLKEHFGYKFQFTALSTLTPYLHNLRGKLIYTVYTEPEKGEYLSELLADKFHKKFTVIYAPDKKALDIFLKIPTTERIISIREYAVIRGATIATPEKAFLDLVNETHSHDGQLDELELKRMFVTMKRSNLINYENLQTYAKSIKKLELLEKIIGDEF
jgi:hypothetical protein